MNIPSLSPHTSLRFVRIGNLFYRHRNWLFIAFYAALLIPSPPLFHPNYFGQNYYVWSLSIGLVITCTGQLIRGLTIGLAYIIRGGKDRKPYAEGLVVTGMFNHARNPMYLGNILMLLGVGVLNNSMVYVVVIIPVFLFIYHTIVLAEENYLHSNYRQQFDHYCFQVPRWLPRLKGINKTISGMRFHFKRWLIKEYNTQFIWMLGITLIILFRYPEFTQYNAANKHKWLAIIGSGIVIYYLTIRYLKKSGRWKN